MTAELELHQEPATQIPLSAQMDYARAVSSASMLPENYRGKPADIMLAVGLGQSMGLSPAESLYRISVIKGKPTASAELIAANVRKAGHRLRVHGDETSCTATIIRADDPDYEFTVTRDMEWAQRMRLADNDNYRRQPGTMLQWRAISAVARLACPEALYGVSYTPDEMGEVTDSRGPGALASALVPQASGTEAAPAAPSTGPVEPSASSVPESPLLNTSGTLARRMFAALGDAGITDKDERLAFCSRVAGRTIATSRELTDSEAERIIAAANDHLDPHAPVDADVVDDDGAGS